MGVGNGKRNEIMAKPTQEKWSVGGTDSGGGSTMGVYCDDATGNRIADCHPQFSTIDRGEARANAVLMAAAPELLAACQEFCRKVDAGEARSKQSYSQMSNAIEKATKR